MIIISFVVNPFIVTDPQSQLAVNDSTVSFTCTAIAFPAPLYNWPTPIPDTHFNTSTITILVDYSYYGNYTCFAESNGTIATSRPALLTGTYVYTPTMSSQICIAFKINFMNALIAEIDSQD